MILRIHLRFGDWVWNHIFGPTRWDHLTADDPLLTDPNTNREDPR